MPVPIQALAYVESQGHEQCLHLVGWQREKLYTRLTMAQLEELLFSQGFLRIHKRFLVNMIYLQTLQSTGAVLTTGHTLPASARSYRDNKQKFVKWQAQQIWSWDKPLCFGLACCFHSLSVASTVVNNLFSAE